MNLLVPHAVFTLLSGASLAVASLVPSTLSAEGASNTAADAEIAEGTARITTSETTTSEISTTGKTKAPAEATAMPNPEEDGDEEPRPPRLRVEGQTLIFDTENVGGDEPDEIVFEDIAMVRNLLQEHGDVDELQLNSGGGSIYASSEIAWIIRDYGLNTIVVGECTSACVDVFLAGARRRMTLGSKIGFHRRSWSPDAVEGYYDDQKERFDWRTPFDFGSWIYEDTQREMHLHLTTMLEHGVDPVFAIETLQPAAADVWYPSRLRLIAGGVLREEAP